MLKPRIVTAVMLKKVAKNGSIIQMKTFYDTGLYFLCKQCSSCCRFKAGVVRLSAKDVSRLSAWAQLTVEQFIAVYCRSVTDSEGQSFISLRERQNYDCVLWENGGCVAYEARPVQCRTFPFWTSCLENEESWKNCAKDCPGIGGALFHSKEEIETQRALYEEMRSCAL